MTAGWPPHSPLEVKLRTESCEPGDWAGRWEFVLRKSPALGPSPGMWVLSHGVAPGWVWLGLVLWDEEFGAPTPGGGVSNNGHVFSTKISVSPMQEPAGTSEESSWGMTRWLSAVWGDCTLPPSPPPGSSYMLPWVNQENLIWYWQLAFTEYLLSARHSSISFLLVSIFNTLTYLWGMNYYYYPIWHVRKLRSRVCKRYRWSQDLNPEALTGFFTKP